MVTARNIVSVGVLVMLAGGTASAASPVRHVPPAGGVAGTALELVAEAPPATPKLVAHYRNIGMGPFAAIELVRRDDAHWVAVVPANDVIIPGLEYYIDAGDEAVFASPQWPHRVEVTASPQAERRARDLARIDGHRTRIHTSAEYVDFGTRTVDGVRLVDRYYRLDGSFSYRLLAYPLEELRVGATQLLGNTQAKSCTDPEKPCTEEVGYKAGGWFELGLGLAEGVRVDGRVLVMATQTGFNLGGRVELRLGVLDGSHVAAGIEAMADVGTNGYFRLGWATVPNVPMSATVEITNMPSNDRDTGVRLYYDVAHAVGSGFKLGIRVGYAARNQAVAGFTTGANAQVDF